MNDMHMFAAKTQARITMILIIGLFFLVLIFLAAAFASGCTAAQQDKLITIAGTVVTQILPIAALAAGFWLARHRATGTEKPTCEPPKEPPNGA